MRLGTAAAAGRLAVALLTGIALVPAYAAAPTPTGVAPQDEALAAQFADALERGAAQGPQSPGTLHTRLGFADFLARAQGGDCRLRLERAQQLLDAGRASPAGAALPLAQAREAALDYQIQVGRAACGSDAAARASLWRAALGSALQAVDLYRDEFDAVAMATMQFNAARLYHELGEQDVARAALEKALAMDREYGFAQDASDNYQVLSQWRGQAADPAAQAAQLQDFPHRSVTLAFGWHAGRADQSTQLDYQQDSEDGTLIIHGTKAAVCQVTHRPGGWHVAFEPRATQYEIRRSPDNDSLVQGTVVALTRLPLPFHDFDLSANGDFSGVAGLNRFESGVRADARAVTGYLAQKRVAERISAQVRSDAGAYAQANEALVAETYNLAAGTWIGASLDQGVWYDMKAPLSMPLLSMRFVTHQIEFAFTRRLPCVSGSADEACIELVMRAVPDPDELARLLVDVSQALRLDRKEALRASSAVYLRLVTDPNTLQPYVSELHRYSYWGTPRTLSRPLIETEKSRWVSGPIAPAG